MQYHWCPFRKQGFELGCSSLIKHLPSRHKALSSIPNAGEREKERDRDGERERERERERDGARDTQGSSCENRRIGEMFYKPRNAKGGQKSPEAKRGLEQILLINIKKQLLL
jgi:hypothetical protein